MPPSSLFSFSLSLLHCMWIISFHFCTLLKRFILLMNIHELCGRVVVTEIISLVTRTQWPPCTMYHVIHSGTRAGAIQSHVCLTCTLYSLICHAVQHTVTGRSFLVQPLPLPGASQGKKVDVGETQSVQRSLFSVRRGAGGTRSVFNAPGPGMFISRDVNLNGGNLELSCA